MNSHPIPKTKKQTYTYARIYIFLH